MKLTLSCLAVVAVVLVSLTYTAESAPAVAADQELSRAKRAACPDPNEDPAGYILAMLNGNCKYAAFSFMIMMAISIYKSVDKYEWKIGCTHEVIVYYV